MVRSFENGYSEIVGDTVLELEIFIVGGKRFDVMYYVEEISIYILRTLLFN